MLVCRWVQSFRRDAAWRSNFTGDRHVSLRTPDCLVVHDLAREQIDVLRVRRLELDALEGSLSALAVTCDTACRTGRSSDCKIIEELQGTVSG